MASWSFGETLLVTHTVGEALAALAYGLRAMRDRVIRVVSEDPPLALPLATAEDTVAHKLLWFRLADHSSDRQWRDLLGVLKAMGAAIDGARLRLACADLGVEDLLERALEESAG